MSTSRMFSRKKTCRKKQNVFFKVLLLTSFAFNTYFLIGLMDIRSIYKYCDNFRKLVQMRLFCSQKQENTSSSDDAYIINIKHVCKNSKPLNLIIVVISSIENFKQRMKVRQTWGKNYTVVNETKNLERGRLVFFVGKQGTENATMTKQIFEESNSHMDIIQADFIDAYFNLSVKSLAMLHWTKTYCPMAQFLVKVDDDVEMYVPKLFKQIKAANKTHSLNFLMGFRHKHYKPKTDLSSKWYVTERESQNYTGPFLAGPAYVISTPVIQKMLDKALEIPLFKLEDVYITGMLASAVGGIQLLHHKGFCHLVSKKRKRISKVCVMRHSPS